MNLKNVGSVTLSLVAVVCIALGGSLNASTLESGGAKVDAAQSEAPSTTATAKPETPTPTEELNLSASNSFWTFCGLLLAGALVIFGVVFRAFLERFGEWLFEKGLPQMSKTLKKKLFKRGKRDAQTLAQSDASTSKKTQTLAVNPTPESRPARLVDEGEPTLAPVSPTPPNFNQLKLPMFANLEKLNSVDFHIWQAVDRSRDQAITIEKNILAGARALKAFSLGYSPLHNPDPMFNELSDADDVVTIDWQRLQYKPIVIDRALTRLCKAGVLERGEWQGSRRVYPLLIPYDAPDKPSV